MEYNEDIDRHSIEIVIKNCGTFSFRIRKGETETEFLLREAGKIVDSLMNPTENEIGIASKRTAIKENIGIEHKSDIDSLISFERSIVAKPLLIFIYKSLAEKKDFLNKEEFVSNSVIELKNINFKLVELIESIEKK